MVAAKLSNLGHGGDRRSDQEANLPLEDRVVGLPVARAAELLNVSDRSVKSARSVQDHAVPELAAAVEQGRVSVSAAADVAGLANDSADGARICYETWRSTMQHGGKKGRWMSRKARSLVIVPFDAAGRRVLDAVRRALDEIGVEVFRFDDIAAGALWASAVTDAIRSSDFLVVDVSRQNPNVFYELGFAHALRKPAILIVSSEANSALPSDLSGFQYIVYEPDNMRSLVVRVQRSAMGFVAKEGESE